jgi:predicted RNA-binding Zn-ribbon protein involved in translation (DUF1610 family)
VTAERLIPCPKCKTPAVPEYLEVDIGVGVQRWLEGVDCPKCGQVGVCKDCRAHDEQEHAEHCYTWGQP